MKAITPCRPKWSGVMTDRRRLNNQMSYQPVDRCFNMEGGYWEDNFRQWPLFIENGVTDNTDAHRFFNFDRITTYRESLWIQPPFPCTVVDETENTLIRLNEDGVLIEVPKDRHDTIPRYVRATIVTPDDWKRCKEERFRRDDPARNVDVKAVVSAHPPTRDYPLGIYCGSMIGLIRNMLTIEGLAYACCDYPDMVEDMVETCCLLVEDHLDQVLPHMDFDYTWSWEDICCKNGPLVSPDFFTRVVAPRYKRIGKKLRAAGITLWYTDCDGDVRQLIPAMLECGINCLFPFEVNGCGHPVDVLNEYGKDLRIMGGVDKMVLVRSKEAIKAYLESLVPLVERGGFIPFCDHYCPPDVKQENYLYYLDLKERMFGITAHGT